MKVSWHGNRKHISARWHTKGLPVLHVAFLREGIQRGFKCYHDLTNKISQLWLTRLLNFHFFYETVLIMFSLSLFPPHRPIIRSIESRIFLHTFCISSALCYIGSRWAWEPIQRFPTQLIPDPPPPLSLTLSFNLWLVPISAVDTFHLRLSINWKAARAHISLFLFDLR